MRAFPVNTPESSQGPPGAPRILLLGLLLPLNGFRILGRRHPSVAAPSRGFTGPTGWRSGTGSSGPGRVIGPVSFQCSRHPRQWPAGRAASGREGLAIPGPPTGCSTRIRGDPSRTRIRAPQFPGAAPLPRPSSDRAPVFGPRDPAFARAAGSHQLTKVRVAPDRGSGPDLGFLRLRDCGNLSGP